MAKRSGLPIPFLKHIPELFRDDSKSTTLANKADQHLTQWEKDVLSIARIYRADEARSIVLGELGYFLAANIRQVDSDLQKRIKIRDAIPTQKVRGTWLESAKPTIDNITGLSPGARLYDELDEDDSIFTGDGLTPSTYYWSTFGVDGIDAGLGERLLTDGTEVMLEGVIYIDCHEGVTTAVLTAAQIAQIVDEMRSEIVPAYFKVYLGYIDGSGVWQFYAGGDIT